MNYLDIYTKEEVDNICLYYGQIPENLQYNLKAILVEKFENEIGNKCEQVRNNICQDNKITLNYKYQFNYKNREKFYE